MSKFMRTCLKCGFNAYSAEDYKNHMSIVHDKSVAQSDVSDARKVDNSMSQSKALDVPEEILVKKPAVEEKKATKAKSRERRAPSEESTGSLEDSDSAKDATAVKKPTKKRGRRSTKKTTQSSTKKKEE